MVDPCRMHGASMTNTWRIHQDPWKIHEKFMEYPRKNHGKSMENPWNIHENSMVVPCTVHEESMRDSRAMHERSMGILCGFLETNTEIRRNLIKD